MADLVHEIEDQIAAEIVVGVAGRGDHLVGLRVEIGAEAGPDPDLLAQDLVRLAGQGVEVGVGVARFPERARAVVRGRGKVEGDVGGGAPGPRQVDRDQILPQAKGVGGRVGLGGGHRRQPGGLAAGRRKIGRAQPDRVGDGRGVPDALIGDPAAPAGGQLMDDLALRKKGLAHSGFSAVASVGEGSAVNFAPRSRRAPRSAVAGGGLSRSEAGPACPASARRRRIRRRGRREPDRGRARTVAPGSGSGGAVRPRLGERGNPLEYAASFQIRL